MAEMGGLSFEFSFDPSTLLKMYRRAMNETFLALYDFQSFESELNQLGIATLEDGEDTQD